MTFFLILVSILNSFAVSLGVGASTLAIINFFVAIADGTIDETERRMMGVVYMVLKVVMLVIFVTTTIALFCTEEAVGLGSLSAYSLAQLIVLFVLYLNALLMSAYLVPTTVGPALQAGSWYMLGTLLALQSLTLTDFTLLQFLLGYLSWLVLAIGVVNAIMAILKAKRENPS
jgi:hypothetical protein